MQRTLHTLILISIGAAATTSVLIAVETKNPTALNETERFNPVTAKGFIERGASYLRREELQKALNDFSEAVRLNPKDASGYAWRGTAYLATGNLEQAILDFDWSLRYNPTNALVYYHRGIAYMVKGMDTEKFEKAISDLNECLRLSPTNAHARARRGDCLIGIGQFEAALLDYTEAIRLDPQDHFPYNGLAWLRATCPVAALRNGKEAVELATKACELTKWGFLPYIDTLAAAYAESGEFDKAVKYQKQAMSSKLAPPDTDREKMRLRKRQQRLSLYEQQKPYREEKKDETKRLQP